MVVTKDLPISPRFTPYEFVSRCKFSTHSYNSSPNGQILPILTFPRFPLRKKEKTQILLDKNRTHDFRTSRCAGYLLDHSRDERLRLKISAARLRLFKRTPCTICPLRLKRCVVLRSTWGLKLPVLQPPPCRVGYDKK